MKYVTQGVLEVETDTGAYVLSARQAAWIPAGLGHVSTIDPTHPQPTRPGAGIVIARLSSSTRAFRNAWGRPPSADRRHGSELPA